MVVDLHGHSEGRGAPAPERHARSRSGSPSSGPSCPHRTASDVTELTYTCPPGADVELYRVQGGGHSWPGSAFSKLIESVVGPTTDSISANEVMWAFFQAHPLRG